MVDFEQNNNVYSIKPKKSLIEISLLVVEEQDRFINGLELQN